MITYSNKKAALFSTYILLITPFTLYSLASSLKLSTTFWRWIRTFIWNEFSKSQLIYSTPCDCQNVLLLYLYYMISHKNRFKWESESTYYSRNNALKLAVFLWKLPLKTCESFAILTANWREFTSTFWRTLTDNFKGE